MHKNTVPSVPNTQHVYHITSSESSDETCYFRLHQLKLSLAVLIKQCNGSWPLGPKRILLLIWGTHEMQCCKFVLFDVCGVFGPNGMVCRTHLVVLLLAVPTKLIAKRPGEPVALLAAPFHRPMVIKISSCTSELSCETRC